jgi:Uma2 family endonuclease
MAVMYAPEAETQEPEYDPVDELLALRDSLDFGKHHDEILEGRLVVSPLPVFWHERVCQWLFRMLLETCDERGWFISRASEIELPPTRDRIEPDLAILTDADKLPDLENVMPVEHVLLVAEVVSPSGIRDDREVKPRSCALAGIPYYLLIDRLVRPLTVTLFSEPGEDGYRRTVAVHVGGELTLPEPFELTLDTGTLPLPK